MSLEVGTNCYISRLDADTYFGDHIEYDTWNGFANDKKDRCLVTATRMIDRQVWQGEKYQDAPTQLLDFPRSGLTDEEGNEIDETTVPQFVLDATCELALSLGKDATVQTEQDTGSDIKRMKAGSAELEFFGTRTTGTRFPTIVHELLGRYLESSSALSGPFTSGTDTETGLEDYELSGGY